MVSQRGNEVRVEWIELNERIWLALRKKAGTNRTSLYARYEAGAIGGIPCQFHRAIDWEGYYVSLPTGALVTVGEGEVAVSWGENCITVDLPDLLPPAKTPATQRARDPEPETISPIVAVQHTPRLPVAPPAQHDQWVDLPLSAWVGLRAAMSGSLRVQREAAETKFFNGRPFRFRSEGPRHFVLVPPHATIEVANQSVVVVARGPEEVRRLVVRL